MPCSLKGREKSLNLQYQTQLPPTFTYENAVKVLQDARIFLMTNPREPLVAVATPLLTTKPAKGCYTLKSPTADTKRAEITNLGNGCQWSVKLINGQHVTRVFTIGAAPAKNEHNAALFLKEDVVVTWRGYAEGLDEKCLATERNIHNEVFNLYSEQIARKDIHYGHKHMKSTCSCEPFDSSL